jgi:hypothetical protein
MTFAAMIRLPVLDLVEQLGPKNVLLNVSRDFKPYAIASDAVHANDNVICLCITGHGDGLAFASIKPECHSFAFAFFVWSYCFCFARRAACR